MLTFHTFSIVAFQVTCKKICVYLSKSIISSRKKRFHYWKFYFKLIVSANYLRIWFISIVFNSNLKCVHLNVIKMKKKMVSFCVPIEWRIDCHKGKILLPISFFSYIFIFVFHFCIGGNNPFQNIDKTSVLQETRTFNETPVNARKCTHILTKILYLINQVRHNQIFKRNIDANGQLM